MSDSVLESLARERMGSLALLSRESGIDESVLLDIARGRVQPDKAHVARIVKILGDPVPDEAFPHRKPQVTFMDVSEAKVLAKREQLTLRPMDVRVDDMIRLVSSSDVVIGWVKVQDPPVAERSDTVAIALRGGSVMRCNPAQTVTVARRPEGTPPS